MNSTVAILGASEKPERYAHQAQQRLMERGYRVIPVSTTGKTVLGVQGVDSLRGINQPVDTVTLYLNPQRLVARLDDLLALKPRRVIFNPGTEEPALQQALANAGIHVVEACTLVLLRIEQFDTA